MTLSRRDLLTLSMALLVSGPLLAQSPTLRALVITDILDDYYRYLNGRDPLTITQYGGPYSRRDVIELVLLQQAFALGGSTARIQFLPYDSSNRMIKDIQLGQVELNGNSMWASAAKSPHVLISKTLIKEGQFEAGLYVLEGHPILSKPSVTLRDLHALTAICVHSWLPDIETLKNLNIPKLILTDSWSSITGMLKKGRADFVLTPFQPTPDLHFETNGIKLKPIPNIKVGLKGTRHFVLSAKMPNAAYILAQLNAGIDIMERKGLIFKAYEESGFFDQRTKHWSRLS